MAKNTAKAGEHIAHELPWPKELSQGLFPGLIWAVMSFFLFLINFTYGLISIAGMFLFFYTQRRTQVGRARRHYVLGRLAYRKENWDEALDSFNKALEIMPQAWAIYPAAGDLYFQTGDLAKAGAMYQKYFQQKHEDHQMRIWYAGKLMEHSRFAEAVRELRKLPHEAQKDLQVVNLLAVSLLKTNRASEAIHVLEPACKKQREPGEQALAARYFLAQGYLQAGEKEKARTVLVKIEQDRPGFEDVGIILEKIAKKSDIGSDDTLRKIDYVPHGSKTKHTR